MALSVASLRAAAPAGLRTGLTARRQAPSRLVARADKKATSTSTSSASPSLPAVDIDTDKIIKDLSEKWDKVEDKTSVIVYGSGAVALLWISSTVVGAINGIPLIPKFLELVGLGYTAWFTYRYLLFKSSRQELLSDIEDLKKKISGDN